MHARERVCSYLKESKRRTNPAHMSKDIDKCGTPSSTMQRLFIDLYCSFEIVNADMTDWKGTKAFKTNF